MEPSSSVEVASHQRHCGVDAVSNRAALQCDEDDSAFSSRGLCSQVTRPNGPSWWPTIVIAHKRSAFRKDPAPGIRKQVRFGHQVRIHCIGESSTCELWAQLDQVHAMCRCLWHLEGQVLPYDAFWQVLTNWIDTGVPTAALGQAALGGSYNVCLGLNRCSTDAANARFHGIYQGLNVQSDINWQVFLSNVAARQRRLQYVEVWFLAPYRNQVCIRSRRIRIEDSIDQHEIQRRCVRVWEDHIVPRVHVDLVEVQPSPSTLRNTVAHIIVTQGLDSAHSSVMLSCDAWPAMAMGQHRAVLVYRYHAVHDIFRIAQFDRFCHNRNRQCYVYKVDAPDRIYTAIEAPRLPHGVLIKGDLMDDASDQESASEASTDSEPSTDIPSDDDSIHTHEDPDCSGDGTSFVQKAVDRFTEPLPWVEIPREYRIQDVFEQMPEFLIHMNSLTPASFPGEVDGSSFMQRSRSRSRDNGHTGSDFVDSDSAGSDHSPPDTQSSEEDPPSPDSEEPDLDTDWHIAFTDMPFDPAPIRSGRLGPTFQEVSRLMNVPLGELVALYPVRHLLDVHSHHVMLVECRGDHVFAGAETMILFEIICHDAISMHNLPNEAHRFFSVHVARAQHSFDTFAGVMRLARLLYQYPDRARMYLNGDRWAAEHTGMKSLHNGDHVAVVFDAPLTTSYRADLIDWLLGQGLSLWPEIMADPGSVEISPTLPFDVQAPLAPELCEATTEELPSHAFQTWFIAHDTHPHCQEGRMVQFAKQPNSWRQVLEYTWNDRMHPGQPFTLTWVTPQPNMVSRAGHAAIPHLIVEQQHRPGRIAVLLTSIWYTDGPPPRQEAFSTGDRLTRSQALEMLELQDLALECDCQVTQDQEIVGSQGIQRPTGQAITVTCRPRQSLPSQAAADTDDTVLMQQMHTFVDPNAYPEIPNSTGCLPDHAVVQEPTAPLTPSTGAPLVLEDQPTDQRAMLNLKSLFDTNAVWQPEEQIRVATVATYFLSPQRMPTCAFPRYVRITPPATHWKHQIAAMWRDQLDMNQPVEVFIVMPPPQQNYAIGQRLTAFALVVQDRQQTDCPYLATIEEEGHYVHIAQITTTLVTQRQLICDLGYGKRCYGRQPRSWCVALHGLTQVPFAPPYQLPLGAGVLISIMPIDPSLQPFQAQNIAADRQTAAPDDPIHQVSLEEEQTFLQLRAHLQPHQSQHWTSDSDPSPPPTPYTEGNSDLCSVAGGLDTSEADRRLPAKQLFVDQNGPPPSWWPKPSFRACGTPSNQSPPRQPHPHAVTILLDPLIETPQHAQMYDQLQDHHPGLLRFEHADWQQDCRQQTPATFQPLPDGMKVPASVYDLLLSDTTVIDWSQVSMVLYVDGATTDTHAAWSVIAVLTDGTRECFLGCLSDVVQLDPFHHSWIGADTADNIAAELTALLIAQSLVLRQGDDSAVIRPDLHLGHHLATMSFTCRTNQTLAHHIRVHQQWLPEVRIHPVPGHSSHPWNDLADAVARFTCHTRTAVGQLDVSALHQLARSPEDLKWVWLQHPPPSLTPCLPRTFDGQYVQFTPSWQDVPSIRPRPKQTTPSCGRVQLTVVSANVLALDPATEQPLGRIAATRTLRLDEQWHSKRIAVAGIQEARTPEGQTQSPHYAIFASGADTSHSAVLGCEIWIHKTLPLWHDEKQTAFGWSTCRPAVLHADPRRLVVKLSWGELHFVVVALHAPYVGGRHTQTEVSLHSKVQVFQMISSARHLYHAHIWTRISEKEVGQWADALRPLLASIARPQLKGLAPFLFSVQTLAGLIGLLPPEDALHLARLRYLRRFLERSPSFLWTMLEQDPHPCGWLSMCRRSFAWLCQHYDYRLPVDAASPILDWIQHIRLDTCWSGRLRTAAAACRNYYKAKAEHVCHIALFEREFVRIGAQLPDGDSATVVTPWECGFCQARFATSRGLAIHSYKKHGYKDEVRYYALGHTCLACNQSFHNRPRLCRHLRVQSRCLDRYRACFAPATEDTVDALDEQDRALQRTLREQGWSCYSALQAAVVMPGPTLPPVGSPEAQYMLAQSRSRPGNLDPAYHNLFGFCATDTPMTGGVWWHDQDLPSFVFQSSGGPQRGDGRLDQHGLAHIYAKLHIRSLVFVHFFSGYRRDGDLHEVLEQHALQGCTQLFVISVDLCMQRQRGDLAKPSAISWWMDRANSGQIVGCGGGPPCETYTAARCQDGQGPRPLRDRAAPWGRAALTPREWQQVAIGSRLMHFMLMMTLAMVRNGGCSFIEHPQWPVWLEASRIASIWGSRQMKLLRSLACIQVTSFDQCIFHAAARKPTTFITARLPTFRRLALTTGWGGRCTHPKGFHQALRGRDEHGHFCTAAHKVYPAALNQAIGQSVLDFVHGLAADGQYQEELPSVFQPFLEGVFAAMSEVQPDYHHGAG
eukprot:Skav221730  [mRNA]  locus=scaffold542:386404:395994:+ [translate_table: standard]